MDRNEELLNGSLAERLDSENWKVRLFALEDLAYEMEKRVSQSISEHLRQLPRFIADKMTPVQEKALDAFTTFLRKASPPYLEKFAPPACGRIVECVFNQRIKNRDKGVEALHLYVEVEAPVSLLVDALVEGAEHRQPKVASTSVSTLLSLVNSFGAHVFPLRSIIQTLPCLFDKKDPSIRFAFSHPSPHSSLLLPSPLNRPLPRRSAAFDLTVELFRWIGPAFKSQLRDLRSVQSRELEQAMDSAKGRDKPCASRFLRSHFSDAKRGFLTSVPSGDSDREIDPTGEPENSCLETEGAEDPYEGIQEVEVVEQLEDSFWEGLESVRWSDRRDTLVQLIDLLSKAKKLSPNSGYHPLYTHLDRIIEKDLSVVCVTKAVDCVGKLASGLRTHFARECTHFVPLLLEKAKDRNKVFCFLCVLVTALIAIPSRHFRPPFIEPSTLSGCFSAFNLAPSSATSCSS